MIKYEKWKECIKELNKNQPNIMNLIQDQINSYEQEKEKYQYKALYGLKVGNGLLSQNDSYIVFDNITAAYNKQNELKQFMDVEVIDLYDYYKEYRGIKEGFKEFYSKVSKMIHDKDDQITLYS